MLERDDEDDIYDLLTRGLIYDEEVGWYKVASFKKNAWYDDEHLIKEKDGTMWVQLGSLQRAMAETLLNELVGD